MRVEGRIFLGIAVFAFVVAIIYGAWSAVTSGYGIEPVGLVALILTGGLCFIIGSYFAFVARRIDPRPEDRQQADVEEGAGDMGFYSPGSYWPVALAAAAAFTGMALAFFSIWMMVIGVVLLILTVGGLLFEYHSRISHE